MPYNIPESIIKEINDLKKRLERLERSPRAVSTSVDTGAFKVIAADTGRVVALFGQLPSQFNRSDGSPQTGVIYYREDSTYAAVLGDLNATIPPYKQPWQILDSSGNIIFADDTSVPAVGIALPYLNWSSFQSIGVPTDTTNSATFVNLQTNVSYKQHPRIQVQILVRSDTAGTTGEVQLIDQANNVLGGVQTIASLQFGYLTLGPMALPGTWHQGISLFIQARRTGGTGTIGVRGIYALGLQA